MGYDQLLNIGCGSVFHPAWRNFDVAPVAKEIERLDLRHRLPFSDESVDVCYASHVLEHLTRENARALLGECYRVMKKGGIIRLVVPDLEEIARYYLQSLEQADRGSIEAQDNYQWMLLELLDQMVREESGGQMHRYLTSGKVTNASFVISRAGLEAERLIYSRDMPQQSSAKSERMSLTHYLRRAREEAAAYLSTLLLGWDGYNAVKKGLFRRSGQVHLWMYDRFSLHQLLQQTGFKDARCCQATESRISDFAKYDLDTIGGRIRKPDSLFMEAVKP